MYSRQTAPGSAMSGPLLMDVRVPEGATPGQSMLVQADTGQQVQIEIPSYAQPGSIIQVSVPQPGGGAPPGGGGDDDLARAIQASLAESGGGISQPAVDPKIEAATVEAISMGFEEEQVRRVQAGRSFTSTSALIDHLVAGGGAEPAPAPGPAPSFSSSPLQAAVPVQAAVAQPVPAQLSPSPQLGMTEEEQMAIAMRESLRMAGADTGGGGEGGGAMTVSRQSRQGTEGSAMDPSHTFRTLVIAMLQGDATARQDLVQNFGDLGSKIHESPRLLYFLLDNAKMDKLNRVPENIVSLWMGYLRRAPSQPKLQELVVMEGQLGKQGSKKWEKTGWKMKWFVMTDSMLCYYNKLADKQKGQEPKKSIPLSAVIRLQSVESSTSGMESSFEIITEQDTPNWKVHAHISDDFGESQLYCSRWQSAIEEAVRGARDLDRAFVNAKPQSYWAEIDAQLQTPHEHVGGDGAPPSQRSAASADSFDPRDAPAERTDDPFAAVTPAEGAADLLEAPTAPEPAPAPGSSSNLIEDILGADISSGGGGGAGVQDANAALLKALSSEDPFGAISFQVEAPAGASGAPMQPMGAMPVMTPSPGMAQAQSGAAPMPVGAQAASPFDPPPPQQGLEAPPASSMPANPFRTEPAPQPAGGVAALNPFRSDGPQQPSPFEAPPAVSAPAQQGMGGTPQRLGTPPGIGGASMVQSQARGVDGAINGNLFDEQARKAPLANPFAAGAKPAAASPGAPNPFASLDNDAWSKAAEKTSTPPQAAPLAEAPVAPAPAPAPAVSPWDSMGKAAAAPAPEPQAMGSPPQFAATDFNPNEAPPQAAAAPSPWDQVGTTAGAPQPVMPADSEEVRAKAAAKQKSDLY